MKISQNKILIEKTEDLINLEYALKKARANTLSQKVEIIYFPRIGEFEIKNK